MEESYNSEKNRFKRALLVPLVFLAVIWVIFALQTVSGFRPGILGVLPRDPWGLTGILFSPLLHGSLDHIVSNSIPFIVMCTSIFYFYEKVAARGFLMMYFLSGIALWLLGNLFFCGTDFNRSCSLPHIGASGVVYALLSFIFWTGIFRKSLQSIILALVVTVMYSGYFAGIGPNQEGNVSWEGHLFGAIVGIFTAFYFRDELEDNEIESMKDIYANEVVSKDTPFLAQDVFSMTKVERRQAELERRRLAELERRRSELENRDDHWTTDL